MCFQLLQFVTVFRAAQSALQWPQARAWQISGKCKEGRWEEGFSPSRPLYWWWLHWVLQTTCRNEYIFLVVLVAFVPGLVLLRCGSGNLRAAWDLLSSRCLATVSLPVQKPAFPYLVWLSSSCLQQLISPQHRQAELMLSIKIIWGGFKKTQTLTVATWSLMA